MCAQRHHNLIMIFAQKGGGMGVKRLKFLLAKGLIKHRIAQFKFQLLTSGCGHSVS